jgi:hypothetical protein
LEVLEDFEEEG